MLQRFLDSMKMDYYKWHEGIGYDLDVLRQMTPAERQEAEKILLQKGCEDWRDVDALDVLGTEAAISVLKTALQSQQYEVRIRAAEKLAKSGHISSEYVEKILVETIPSATILNGLSFTFRLAEKYPTEAVRRAVLKTAMDGHDDARCLAAALAEYLFGASKSAFNFHRQQFYLRFNEQDPAIRKEAFFELCRNVHVDPQTI